MHIFLIGGTGSIGSAVLRQTLLAGHRVTALARSEATAKAMADIGADILRGDMASPEAWMPQASQADVFIHLGSSFDDEMAITEPRLLHSLLTHAKTRSTPLRLLYTGGCWMFGQTGNAVATETSPMTPISAFAWASDAIASLQDQPHLNLAVIHPAMVYHEAGGVFDRMLSALSAKRPVPIWGSEKIRWPLVHREDTASAYVLLAETPRAIGTFNVVSEQGVAVGEIARVLSEQAGIKTPPAVLPHKWALLRHGAWAEGPMLDQQMRDTRLAGLGWMPQYPDFSTLNYSL